MKQSIRTNQQLGQLLVGRRKALGLSQQALGAKVGISQKRQSGLELQPGRVTVDRLLGLLAALGLELVVQDREPASPGDSTRETEW